MTESTLSISDSIDQVDPGEWDSLSAGQSFFLSRAYLAAVECHGPKSLGHRYLVLSREGRPAAAMSLQILDISGGQLAKSAPSAPEVEPAARPLPWRLAQWPRDAVLRRMGGRVAVCGNFFSTGPHGMAFAAGESPQSLWSEAVRALHRFQAEEGGFGPIGYTMFKDIPADPATGADVFRRFGYRRLESEPDMRLELPPEWRSFDDYLESLRTKYRKAVCHTLDSIDAAGVGIEPLKDLDAHAGRLHALYKAVEARAKVSFASFPAGYLPALARAAGADRFRCTVARREDEILGFMATVRDGDTAVAHYAGLDYAANEEIPIYLRLLYTVIADAIDWRCRRASFGRTALESKARLGARPVELASWLRHRDPAMNLVVWPLVRLIPHRRAPDRHPFK